MNKVLDKAAVKIAEGQNTQIFYRETSDYGQPVIIKVLKDECNFYPHTSQIINEDEHIRGIKTKGIRSSLDRIIIDNKPAIILEYLEGNTLKDFIQSEDISFVDKLKVAISLSEKLGNVHELGIIHKDFSSHNILVNDAHDINIIDFGFSTRLNTKSDVKPISEYLEGTLPYISPEQTGRVNHVVDQRSDLYSLGVVLYELFSGQLPFTSEDPMELVHAHLAILPVPLRNIIPEIPGVISDIVAKLLSKNLESRYQTSYGVFLDLQKCYDQLELKIAIEDFEIAQEDQSGKFFIPSKLYGREKETSLLLEAFEQIDKENRVALIKGYSGTGKTSLIYEIHKPLTQKRGHFVHGKHEQFQKDIPYHAIVQAFKSFVNLLLSDKMERLEEWRNVIKKALGKEGKLLTDLVPNLELIIGKQEPLQELGINEAQHRFDYTFMKFMRAIATRDHPLILFIDDLQWADAASLHLLKKIICDEELKNFYFIGAYRGNEIDETHPTSLIIKEIKDQDITVNEIELLDLKLEDIQKMIADTLSTKENKCRGLAELIFEKTAGNPFFVNQFLLSMYENRLIEFKRNAHTSHWDFDLEGIKKMNFTDNVVEFMIGKIESLDGELREILKLGSCIGDSFDLETLVSISEKGEHEVIEYLYEVVNEQFLILQGDNPDFVHLQNKYGDQGKKISAQYKFSHDRIRQAAYAMVPQEQKSALHLQIGRLMLQNIPPEKLKENIFDVVFQLNNGLKLISSIEEKKQLAHLNYDAANKAAASSAYHKALSHFETALSLVTEQGVESDKVFLMSILNGAMQCAYLSGDYKRMEQLGNEIANHSDSILDEIDAHRITILSFIARNRYRDATDFGLKVLRKLNIKFPKDPNKLQILASFVKTKFALRNKSASYFGDLRYIHDQKVLAAIKIIISFASAAYHNTPELFPLVVMKMLRMSLKYGFSTDLISTYGGYGILLCGITGEMEEGYAYGQESLKMLESFSNARHASGRTLVIYTTFINHWKDHLKESFPLLMRSYYDAMETGDHEFAAGALFVHSYHSFLIGESLHALVERMGSHHRKIKQLNQKSYESYDVIGYQAVANLWQNSSDPSILKGEIFDEDDFFADKDGIGMREDKTALFHYHFYKMSLHYLTEHYEEALENSDTIKKLDVAVSTALIPQAVFYDSLIGLALINNTSIAERKKWLKRINSNQKKMKKWASHAPMNYAHKYDIIEASLSGIIGKDKSVTEALIDRSLRAARESGYTNDLAIAYELAGIYYLSKENEEKANSNIKSAHIIYQKWGVAVKLRIFSKRYEAILNEPKDESISRSRSYVSISTGNSLMDLSTVMKASTTLSSEIKMKNLVQQLLKIVAENAGAQKGAFVFNDNDTLKIKAVLDDSGEVSKPVKESIEKNENIPESIIQYVYRTKEDLVLDNACKDLRFAQDQFIKSRECKSLLCIPVISKKKLIGIIYLENNLVSGAFTPQRLELLKMLSGQIAISLENSILYNNLERKVEERTREIDQQKEELKRKNIELMDINNEKDDLINVVSHDLRSPLNQVKGLAQIITMESDDKNIKEYSDKITEAIDRLNVMITRILDVSAIEAQKVEIKSEEFDVVDQIRYVVESFQQNAKRKQIELVLKTENEQEIVELDKNYFIQIMENLLSNAIKFSYEKGVVEVLISQTQADIKVEVKDTGPGISEADQKMLFSKFQKLTAKPTAGEKSTGLGLAIVKRYVDAMGGEIWCESELYNGASFFVAFSKK